MFNRLVILLGIICLFISGYFLFQKESNTGVVVANEVFSGQVDSLVINDLSINVPVLTAVYKNGKWQADGRGVFISDNIIYGHNWDSLLADLPQIKVGTEILLTLDGSRNIYKVVSTQVVDNNSDKKAVKVPENYILIYTCTGFLDSQRFLVMAEVV